MLNLFCHFVIVVVVLCVFLLLYKRGVGVVCLILNFFPVISPNKFVSINIQSIQFGLCIVVDVVLVSLELIRLSVVWDPPNSQTFIPPPTSLKK